MIMKHEPTTDAILVSNYIKGDECALEVLIKRHKQRIYSFIYSKVYDAMLPTIFFRILLLRLLKP